MYVIGIDSGTQGTKALIVDIETGEVRGGLCGPRNDRRPRARRE
jgi:N-acetylglucosamine kinase-like BadF-type ATPase